MNIKNPEKQYRPNPFWSWNEKLDTEETKRQIEKMEKVGLGGYFMHARGGLQTEYMGKEWFENINIGIEEGKTKGMGAWAYDENGWPSGFGNGLVNGKGVSFQQKFLKIENGEKNTDTTIINVNGYHLYYEINPFYVDTLNKDVAKTFIEEIYDAYYNDSNNNVKGVFTDEPHISRDAIPWSFKLPEAYKSEYGEDLLPILPELFKKEGKYKETRFKFWKLVTKMFSENFVKPLYDWCDKRSLKFTGHLLLEETLLCQLTTNGAIMPHYEYFHIPGMDWLGRRIGEKTTPLQVSSVAHQLGKKQILSESFALSGWNVSFEELKWIYEWQMVRGINLLCPHLQGYSLRGIRKRDYPASFFYQQPWWNEYKVFIESISRIGMLLTEGKVKYNTLLIHPQSSAWICYDDDKNEGVDELNKAFFNDIDILEKKHILFHLGDETIIERHATVKGNKLIIGTQEYDTIILPMHLVLFENTKRLLNEFKENGGVITTADKIYANKIIDNENVTYTKREFKDFDMHYFVNSTDKKQKAVISKGTCVLNIKNGNTEEFCPEVEIEPFGSIVVFDGIKPEKNNKLKENLKLLPLSGEWKIKETAENALTLDYCGYWFDGELIENNGHISSVGARACSLGRRVKIDMLFKVKANSVPKTIYLVCETPEIFTISINGKKVDNRPSGYYFDKSFKKINVSGYLKTGENEILLSCDFKQSKEVYENIEKAKIYASELNKLTFDMEIESIYLVGDFSVKTEGEFNALDKDAVRYSGDFLLDIPKEKILLNNIEQQGFVFFAGSLTVEKKFVLDDNNYCLSFENRKSTYVKVRVNGKDVDTIVWKPYKVDLSDYLIKGENTVELTFVNSLRNLLGPHHAEDGECYEVTPTIFFKDENLWDSWGRHIWNDNYCFTEFGID